MKASIDVKSREEAANVRAALADDFVRAFVQVMGVCANLSTGDVQRLLALVAERLVTTPKGEVRP